MKALAGHTRFAGNVTQDLFNQTAQALSAIVKATVTDREQIVNIVVSAAPIQQ